MPAPTSRTTGPTPTINGDKVVLNGVKTLISRADEAHCFIVFTRVDGKPGREGIGCVLVDRGDAGLRGAPRAITRWAARTSPRSSSTTCELPLENLIIREDGFRSCSRLQHAALPEPLVSLGLAEGAFEEAVKYARDRTTFGRPIGAIPGRCAGSSPRCTATSRSSRSMLYRAAASANPFPDPVPGRDRQDHANEMALRVTSEAIQVHGGYGFTDEYPGLALLPRRALRHARRRHDRDAEGPRRQAHLRRLPARTAS